MTQVSLLEFFETQPLYNENQLLTEEGLEEVDAFVDFVDEEELDLETI